MVCNSEVELCTGDVIFAVLYLELQCHSYRVFKIHTE